jgi:hypothetical protein
MPWIPEQHMTDVRIIRQDFALARAKYDAEPTRENLDWVEEITARRARAIRSLHRDDGASARHLSAMFRCSKTTIREALADDTD